MLIIVCIDLISVDVNVGVVFVGSFVNIIIVDAGAGNVSFCLAAFCVDASNADTVVIVNDVVFFIIVESAVIVVVAASTGFISVICASVGVA